MAEVTLANGPWMVRIGTQGKQVYVTTNAYALDWTPQGKKDTGLIYQYDVMTPGMSANRKIPSIGRRKARELMDRLQVRLRPEIFNGRGAFDGQKILWCTQRLDLGPANAMEFDVHFTEPDPQNPIQNPTMVHITIKDAGTAEQSMLGLVTKGDSASNPDALKTLNALNVVFQQAPLLGQGIRDGRKIFLTTGTQRPNRKLAPFDMIRGYFQSVRPVPLGLMVNVDTANGLMIRPGPLQQFCEEFLGGNPMKLLNLSAPEYQRLRYALKGVVVTVNLPAHRGRRRRYHIQDLVKAAGNYVFTKGADKITVAEHFLQAYGVRIKSPQMIGVTVGSKGDVFPLQVCNLLPNQLFKKPPPPHIQRELVTFAAQRPEIRLQAIRQARIDLAYDNLDTLTHSGFSVSPNTMMVEARLIDPPEIMFRNNIMMKFPDNRIGTWNVRDYGFLEPKAIGRWIIVDFTPGGSKELLYRLGVDLQKVMNARGMSVPQEPIYVPSPASIVRTFQDYKPDFALFVLEPNSPDLYRTIKRAGDIEGGVATQCARSDQKFDNQYLNNLALKVNMKLGGTNSIVRSPTMDGLKAEGVMVLGADVSHPSDNSQPSIAALVSSWDDYGCKYVASIKIQEPRTEVIADMEDMVTRALRCYYNTHRDDKNKPLLPKVLLFFRDGISEGEFRTIARTEMAAINRACIKAYGSDKLPKFVFIVVGKRHHTRFFPEHPTAQADPRSGNCRSGLVVDRGVAHPAEANYYLQSQPGLKGTSRPSHYVVLMNTYPKVLNADRLQQISYGLCFAYGRASRAVSIPAPVYYADLVCRRARIHFDDQVSFHADYASDGSGPFDLNQWQQHFTPISANMENKMYFV